MQSIWPLPWNNSYLHTFHVFGLDTFLVPADHLTLNTATECTGWPLPLLSILQTNHHEIISVLYRNMKVHDNYFFITNQISCHSHYTICYYQTEWFCWWKFLFKDWSTLFFCLHWEMKGHWSRVNLVKPEALLKDLDTTSVLSFPNANQKSVFQSLYLCL